MPCSGSVSGVRNYASVSVGACWCSIKPTQMAHINASAQKAN